MRHFLAVVVAASVAGCNNLITEHTVKAVQKCIDANKTDLISSEIIRAACISKHQTVITAETEGRAGYKYSFETMSFSGTIRNKSQNKVITSISVNIRHKDMPSGASENKRFDDIWIPPNEEFYLMIYQNDLKFQPSKDKIGKGADGNFEYDWSISALRGLVISVD